MEAIEKVLKEKNPWPTPKMLKNYLELKRRDGIDIKLMKYVDDMLNRKAKCQVNVTGDHCYTSTAGKLLEINLKLLGGHYKLDLAERKG